MKTILVKNPDVKIFLLGSDSGIIDITKYTEIQDNHKNLSVKGFINRILLHQVYGYIKPVTFHGFFLAFSFNWHLLRCKRLATTSDWYQAYVISFPEAAKIKLGFTDEEIKEMASCSKWSEIITEK